jgi:hypothetical protein
MSRSSINLNSDAHSVFPSGYKFSINESLRKSLPINAKRPQFLVFYSLSKPWHES